MGLTPLQIENAVHSVLKAGAVDYAFSVEQYNGRAGSNEDLANWIAMVQVPAIAIFYNGSDYDPNATAEYRRLSRPEAEIEVWIITDNLRDLPTRFQEKKGIYSLSQIVYGTLMNADCGLAEMEPLYFLREGPLLNELSTGRTVWQTLWRTKFTRSENPLGT